MHSTSWYRRLLSAMLAIAFALGPAGVLGGYRENMHATSVEIAQLPLFCWAQFEVPNTEGDQFRIHDCGPAWNHYCPALLGLQRGKNPASKGRPLSYIGAADIDVRYTEIGIREYPKCSIREHVAATRAEINQLLRMYGGKPAGAK